ncbi:Nucleolar protein [Phytophthora palmivora]|uniref:Nucleolar protein n=1 Tax=Phytophthora palmivora TaxID=4796 RepID=A0A2P4YUQ3_9STRA|nr:Nucleolar protein [Phytophthora palmivora]
MAFKKGGNKKVASTGKKQKHGFIRSSSRGANPFDVRSNASKQKHEVIGRRVKGAGRNVAAARAEAERKRHKTLGAEYKARNKSNVFKDKRLGEQDPTLSMEDKMMARFQTERKRKLRNASTFALHDSDSEQEDETLFLTHKGAKITEDDYDRLNVDGPLDEEDEEGRKMDREIVDQLHFGGGKEDADALEKDGKRKTHKEVMQEVMMKAKLYKAERQKNKTSQEDATDKLIEGIARTSRNLRIGHALTSQMCDTAGVVVRERLVHLHQRLCKKASTSAWPTLPELLLFKALTSIFPTSDLRHNVVSPMETLLDQSPMDMTRSKERFMPEVVTFLTRILRAFVTSGVDETMENDEDKTSVHWLRRDLLEWVSAPSDEGQIPAFLQFPYAGIPSCSGVQVLSSLLALLDVSSAQYASLPSFDELFYPLYLLLHALVKQLEDTPHTNVLYAISKLHTRLESCWNVRRPLRLQSFAPTTLPTFAPHFDENYTVRKDKTAPKDRAQLKQLQRQVKRARKGAARELRRDAEFIHREKQKEEEARLAAKEEKQKEIRRWLDEQNATFNQQVRKGGHMLKGGGSARGPAPRARTPRK